MRRSLRHRRVRIVLGALLAMLQATLATTTECSTCPFSAMLGARESLRCCNFADTRHDAEGSKEAVVSTQHLLGGAGSTAAHDSNAMIGADVEQALQTIVDCVDDAPGRWTLLDATSTTHTHTLSVSAFVDASSALRGPAHKLSTITIPSTCGLLVLFTGHAQDVLVEATAVLPQPHTHAHTRRAFPLELWRHVAAVAAPSAVWRRICSARAPDAHCPVGSLASTDAWASLDVDVDDEALDAAHDAAFPEMERIHAEPRTSPALVAGAVAASLAAALPPDRHVCIDAPHAGSESAGARPLVVDFVVAHCKEDTTWIRSLTREAADRIFVYSKCGATPHVETLEAPGANRPQVVVTSIGNAGSEEYVYLLHAAGMLNSSFVHTYSSETAEYRDVPAASDVPAGTAHVVVFVQAAPAVHQRDLLERLNLLRSELLQPQSYDALRVAGFQYLVDEASVIEYDGCPAHCGLHVGAFYESYFLQPYPSRLTCHWAAQFVATRAAVQRLGLDHIQRLLAVTPAGRRYPNSFIIERLWHVLFGLHPDYALAVEQVRTGMQDAIHNVNALPACAAAD